MATMYSCNVGCVSTTRPLKTILMEKGLIAPKTLHSKKREVHFNCVLDYKKCNPDEWAKQLVEILERGVIDFSKRNEFGDFGERRDYTPDEQEELGFYPVYFTDDGTHMYWEARWQYNLDPLFYISKALPNDVFTYDMTCEGKYDAGAYYQDGTYLGDKPVVQLTATRRYGQIGEILETLERYNLRKFANLLTLRAVESPTEAEVTKVYTDYVLLAGGQ